MEKLAYKAKIAVIKVLSEILHVDGIVHEMEVKYMNEVIGSFNLEGDYQTDVDNLMTHQALSTISELSDEQKGEVAKMMGKMIVVDEDINYNEVKLYNSICKSCDIAKEFNVEDYPEFSLSGPFVNPEELLDI